MGIVDPSILMGGGNALGEGISQGMKLRQGFQQGRDDSHDRQAMHAFQTLAQGQDITSKEGLTTVLKGMTQQGFGDHAFKIFAANKDLFAAEKPTQKAFQSVETDQGLTPFDAQTGTYGSPAMGPNGQPLRKPVKPEAPTPGKFQLVKNKRGQMESVDVSTGLNAKGQPVDAWTDPQKPDGPKSTDIFTQEQQLRTQYLGQTKDFRDVRDAFGRIKSSANDPSAAGDLSLIFNYMKVLDPGSTVREGEFANAQNAGSAWNSIGATYNKVMSGERLTEKQRADFVGRAKMLYSRAEFQKNKTQAGYRKMASQYPGLNPDRVLMDDDITVDTPAQPPAADPAKIAKAKAYMALPPDSPFRTPAHDAAAKAILGVQ